MNSFENRITHPIFHDDITFNWHVTVPLPDNGCWQPISIKTRFRLLPADVLQQLLDEDNPVNIMQRLIVALHDDQDKLLDADQFQRIIRYFPVQKAMIAAYQTALIGEEAKN